MKLSTSVSWSKPWPGQLHAKKDDFSEEYRPKRAKICLSSAREDLQVIVSATLAGSLGSEAPNIGFMVETAANFMPREEDFYAEYPS